MQEGSSPIEPDLLGVLTARHFRSRIGDQNFRYVCLTAKDKEGILCTVECAIAVTQDPLLRGVHIGLNWGVPLHTFIKHYPFRVSDRVVIGLTPLLKSRGINLERDPVCFALHLIYPWSHGLWSDEFGSAVNADDVVADAILELTKSRYNARAERVCYVN
jgi:hypothetical protein